MLPLVVIEAMRCRLALVPVLAVLGLVLRFSAAVSEGLFVQALENRE